MDYFRTDFSPQKFFDERSVLDELLQHNGIFSQISLGISLKEYEDFIKERGWLPPDFDFQKLYFQKIK